MSQTAMKPTASKRSPETAHEKTQSGTPIAAADTVAKTQDPQTQAQQLQAQQLETEAFLAHNEKLLADQLNESLGLLGYEAIAIELILSKQKKCEVYIDFVSPREGVSVGIEDCVIVTKALDESLDANPIIQSVFKDTPYELEVSSPGIDRPLRREKDFLRFVGSRARIHTVRAVSETESLNPEYSKKKS